MAFKFPFTNYHELNLTWVLDQLKKLFEESAENVSTIQNYDGRLTAVETELPTVSETASEASRAAAAAGTLAQTAKATADTAQENAVQAQSLAGTARQEAQNAQTAADAATQAAQQAQATAQNFDGRITQAENDAASALEASRSFENRVQAAINTANNAASTATNAQGIATNANQNAAAALDKIGNLAELRTAAKQNLVTAVNEVAMSGGSGVSQYIIAPVETSETASRAYSNGDMLMYNNVLYKAITDIVTGETLTPGSNIEITTVSEEIDVAKQLPDLTPTNDRINGIINFLLGSDFFTIRYIEMDVIESINQGSISAPIVEGYSFLSWIGVSPLNFLGSAYAETANASQTTLWSLRHGSGSGRKWRVYAIYVNDTIKNDTFIVARKLVIGNTYNKPVNADNIDNYTFMYWINSASSGWVGNSYYRDIKSPNTLIMGRNAGNINCYALYVASVMYSDYISIETLIYNINKNIDTNRRVNISAPVKEGYTFLYWVTPCSEGYYGSATIDNILNTTSFISDYDLPSSIGVTWYYTVWAVYVKNI